MKLSEKQIIVEKMNNGLKPFFDTGRAAPISDQSGAFIADSDQAICFDIHFYEYDDQFKFGDYLRAVMEAQAGLEFEEIGDGNGDGTYLISYRQKI